MFDCKDNQVLQKTLRTKENFNRPVIMTAISAAGIVFTPCLIYSGVTPRFRRVHGRVDTIQNLLMKCIMFHLEVPGVV